MVLEVVMVLVLVSMTGCERCLNVIGFIGMTSGVGGGNGRGVSRHDRLYWWK